MLGKNRKLLLIKLITKNHFRIDLAKGMLRLIWISSNFNKLRIRSTKSHKIHHKMLKSIYRKSISKYKR